MKTKVDICTSLFVLLVVGFVLVLCFGGSTENYKKCICSQTGDQRECQDTDTVQLLYDQGVLTEFTNLPNKGWGTVSPGDINYPKSEGCAWGDKTSNRLWTAWDFTDF